jgi:hypothetical protein
MGKFGVFKRESDGESMFVSWAETLKDSKKRIQDLVNSDGHFSYFVHDFLRDAEVWSWSPSGDGGFISKSYIQ